MAPHPSEMKMLLRKKNALISGSNNGIKSTNKLVTPKKFHFILRQHKNNCLYVYGLTYQWNNQFVDIDMLVLIWILIVYVMTESHDWLTKYQVSILENSSGQWHSVLSHAGFALNLLQSHAHTRPLNLASCTSGNLSPLKPMWK